MQPFTLNVMDRQGAITEMLVRPIAGSRRRALELLDRNGRPSGRRIGVTIDGNPCTLTFDSLWVDDDGTVHAMRFYTGVKIVVLGNVSNAISS